MKRGRIIEGRRARDPHKGYATLELPTCADCRTEFHPRADGSVSCNGHTIGLCPWCREDSRPWTAGRGK